MGDSKMVGFRFACFDGVEFSRVTAGRFARASPDLGERAGLIAAGPRITGVFFGDTGVAETFGEATSGRLLEFFAEDFLEGGVVNSPVPPATAPVVFFRADAGSPIVGARESAPLLRPLLEGLLALAAARACLMFLNCRWSSANCCSMF